MNEKIVILDCNYLCHRAKHVFGDLSFRGSATGVIYGFLRDIRNYQRIYDTNHMVFCWDSKTNKREKIYPLYKAHRKDKYAGMGAKERRFEGDFQSQMRLLRSSYLPEIGYKNIFIQDGYESDDIIASVCFNLALTTTEVVIVSSDSDLFQLISPQISIHTPQKQKKTITLQSFFSYYGIVPSQWIEVKAIAGCTTDNIKGVEGVGEKTAIKYIRGELKTKSQAYAAIKNSTKIINRNRILVTLPYEGTDIYDVIKKDEFSRKGWKDVCKKLGIKSLLSNPKK